MTMPHLMNCAHSGEGWCLGCVANLQNQCDELRAVVEKLRRLVATTYAGASLYADDGELQDNRTHPLIDFKRDTPWEIGDKMRERGRAALAAAGSPVGSPPRQENHNPKGATL